MQGDSLAVDVQLPMELWRRGSSSVLLELGLGVRIPVGDDPEVILSDSPTNFRIHSYQPEITFVAHFGLRFQFGYSPTPSLE